jgi:hypothetical protein
LNLRKVRRALNLRAFNWLRAWTLKYRAIYMPTQRRTHDRGMRGANQLRHMDGWEWGAEGDRRGGTIPWDVFTTRDISRALNWGYVRTRYSWVWGAIRAWAWIRLRGCCAACCWRKKRGAGSAPLWAWVLWAALVVVAFTRVRRNDAAAANLWRRVGFSVASGWTCLKKLCKNYDNLNFFNLSYHTPQE